MTEDQYLKLKENFCKYITNEQLDHIKTIHRDDINSVRRFESIQTTYDLIDILERRGVISQNRFMGFVSFYEVLPTNPEIPEILHSQNNKENEVAGQPVNQYGKKLVMKILLISILIISSGITLYYTFGLKTAEDRQTQPSIYEEALREEFQQAQAITSSAQSIVISNPVDLNKFQDRKHIIYKLISEEIGRKWRDLGRELKIKEGQLDDLESKHNTSKSRTLEIFKMFEEKSDPRSIVVDICEALIQVRRNDLRKEVEKILIR